MASEWTRRCRGDGMVLEGDAVRVSFADGRTHIVRIEEQGDALHLSAVVLGAARARAAEADEVRVWKHNQGSRLTSFRLDASGRIVGEAFMPLAGLTAEAARFRVRILAEECDHLERVLTGSDVE